MAAMIQHAKGFEIGTEEGYKRWKRGNLNLEYTPGMQTDRVSEAISGAVPEGCNTPQRPPFGLYSEQLSGTSFTTPRVKNQRNWVYRVLPAVKHTKFRPLRNQNKLLINDFSNQLIDPTQCRWDPLPISTKKTKFYEGIVTYCGAGSPESRLGMAVHMYQCNESMIDESFCNADGDILIVPQKGDLLIRTEYGWLEVPSGFIAVIQRGIHFSVMVKEESRGYIAEIFESHFVIPDLGPIGANGLANSRDFETCVASYDDKNISYQNNINNNNNNNSNNNNNHNNFKLVQKFLGKLFEAQRDGTIYDVVGWHGNYVPFRYDLSKFCVINSVSYDHIDPSIFTVLTAQTAHPGVAACDFVIFPPRWSVHTSTFRPPYYHRNCMSEFMGNIRGIYEAKRTGFLPGGGTLHSCMTPHGPDANTWEIGTKERQIPIPPKDDALAFMFESAYTFRLTEHALHGNQFQQDYNQCWQPLKSHFNPNSKL